MAIFLGMLELVRLGGISLTQSEAFGEIVIQRERKDVDASNSRCTTIEPGAAGTGSA